MCCVLKIEANKRREVELQKLRRDLQETQTQNEFQLSSIKKKQQDQIAELTEQLDQLQKLKQKYNFTSCTVYEYF